MARVLRDGAFEGETHIVTGAAQGIGRAVATALAEHGAQVLLVDLDEGRLKETRGRDRRGREGEADLLRRERGGRSARARAVAHALEATGVMNGVVNVAGITRDARIPKKSFDDFKLVVGVHLYGTFLFTREVAAQRWHVLFKNDGQPAARGRREPLRRELLVGLGAQRQHRADRLHRREGRDRIRHEDDRARVLRAIARA